MCPGTKQEYQFSCRTPAQAHAQRDINCLSDPDRATRRHAVRTSALTIIQCFLSLLFDIHRARRLTAGCCMQLRRLQTKLLEGSGGIPAASPRLLQVVATLLHLKPAEG